VIGSDKPDPTESASPLAYRPAFSLGRDDHSSLTVPPIPANRYQFEIGFEKKAIESKQ
jgi:hypothetical protein